MTCDECGDEFVSLGTGDTTCEECIDMMDDDYYDDEDDFDDDYDDEDDDLLERQEMSDFAQDDNYGTYTDCYDGDSDGTYTGY